MIIKIARASLAYFFIEVEVLDEDSELIENNLESGKELQKHDDHPGWLWNTVDEEWIEDPNHISK